MLLRFLVLLHAMGSAITADAKPAARPTRKLVVTLDVHAADAPRYLCVISDLAGCSDAQRNTRPNSCPRPLASVLPALAGDRLGALSSSRRISFDAPLSNSTLPPDLMAAWSQLVRNDDPSCAVGNAACKPELELPDRMFADPGFPPHVVCSNRNASGHDGDVAFLYMYFSRSSIDSGVSQIELQGTNATITFYSDIDARDYVYAEVIGGAYASSARTLVGTQERLLVPLAPRCELYVAELPPHAGLSLPTATIQTTSEATPLTCTASGVDSSSFQIRVPYSDRPHLTTLRLEGGASSFETSWTEPLPPKPLRLAVRSLELGWRRDCMSGSWPSSDTFPPQPLQTEWSAECPRASIAAAGVTCELLPPGVRVAGALPDGLSTPSERLDLDVCRYRCQVPAGIAPFQLPTPIQLDRLRVHDGPSGSHVETVYSWNDTLHYTGEELRSFVTLADRRVMVEIDPEAWAEQHGEPLEEINLLWPSGARGIIDLTRNKKWSRWRAMPAPGITCTDQVHVTVAGARAYESRNFPVEGGRIVLPAPSEFLCPIGRCLAPLHLWAWAGVGLLSPVNERAPELSLSSLSVRPHSYGSLGSTLEIYKSLWLPSSVELDVSGDLGQTSFGTLQQQQVTHSFEDVWYSRMNVMARYVWWRHPDRHFSLAAGAAVGFPFGSTNGNKIGTTWSSTLELGARFRLLHRNDQWFEAAGGVRWGEEHPFFEDLAHGGDPSERALLQLYLAGRFRFLLG
jgi:hypothetical protein